MTKSKPKQVETLYEHLLRTAQTCVADQKKIDADAHAQGVLAAEEQFDYWRGELCAKALIGNFATVIDLATHFTGMAHVDKHRMPFRDGYRMQLVKQLAAEGLMVEVMGYSGQPTYRVHVRWTIKEPERPYDRGADT